MLNTEKKSNRKIKKSIEPIVSYGSRTAKHSELKRKLLSYDMTVTSGYARFDPVGSEVKKKKMNGGIPLVIYKRVPNYDFWGALSSLKADIRRQLENMDIDSIPHYTSSDIRFYNFDDTLRQIGDVGKKIEFNGAKEFDISKAYYQAGYFLRYISAEEYLTCLSHPKDIRLRLMGSIATVKQKFKYRNGKMVGEPEDISDKLLQRVWFHICKHVDNCMWQFKSRLGDNFYFYWVDGIYFKQISDKSIQDFIIYAKMKYGMTFIGAKIDKLELIYGRRFNLLNIYRDGEKKPKPLNVPQIS